MSSIIIDEGINTILPEEVYPLSGTVLIKNENEKIIMFEEGTIYRGRNIIYIEIEGNFNSQLNKIINNDNSYIYKYEFISKTKVKIEDEIYNNIYITGQGQFSGSCDITFDIKSKITLCFQPLFNHKDWWDFYNYYNEEICLTIW